MMFSLLPVISSAAPLGHKTEPVSVFTSGQGPAWSHAHSTSSTEEHAAFHEKAEAELALWTSDNAKNIGTSDYARAKRAFLIQRDKAHRTFHHWNDLTDAQKAWREKQKDVTHAEAPSRVQTRAEKAKEMLSTSDFSPNIIDHRYEGSRPSARLLAETR